MTAVPLCFPLFREPIAEACSRRRRITILAKRKFTDVTTLGRRSRYFLGARLDMVPTAIFSAARDRESISSLLALLSVGGTRN